MTTNYLNLIFISTLFVIFFSVPVFTEDCDSYHLFNFGLKPFCELYDGNPVSCFGSLAGVKNAYIQCDKGYYQRDKMPIQVLECNDKNGEWSDKLMDCSPNCIEPPNELKLLTDDNNSYPPWYVEIIRKVPTPGRVSKIPGMIFYEREILIVKEHAGNFGYSSQFAGEHLIRIYQSKTQFTDYRIQEIKCNDWKQPEFDEYCIVVIPFKQYIKFNEDQKPICVEDSKLKNIIHRRNRRIPKYVGPCIMPRISDPKLEIVCFRDNPQWNYITNRDANTKILTDCRKEPSFIITRCRIGYQYKKPVEIDYLSNCNINIWFHKPDNGCDQVCGEIDKNVVKISSRIFEGDEFDITSAPWHVGIFANNTDVLKQFEQICGGTIVHSNVVLSAAHCFYDEANHSIYEAYNYLVGAGKNFREYNATEVNGYYVEIKRIYVTKNYQSTGILNDIAILILKEHLKYSSYIRPACIDFTQYYDYNVKNGIKGYIMGWGAISKDGDDNNNLFTANLSTLTNDECKKLVRPQLRNEIIGDKFCATNEKKSTACQGDSGGGFIVKQNIGDGDRYYITGIISNGIDRQKICSSGFLTLFTNIQFYQNFINDIISEERNLFFY